MKERVLAWRDSHRVELEYEVVHEHIANDGVRVIDEARPLALYINSCEDPTCLACSGRDTKLRDVL